MVYKVIAGMGLLIALFLILSNSKDFSSIIGSLSSGGNTTIKTLQGR